MIALLLSLIGLSNVFSATLGHIQQRKREFARYSALGFSPKNIRQILIYLFNPPKPLCFQGKSAF